MCLFYRDRGAPCSAFGSTCFGGVFEEAALDDDFPKGGVHFLLPSLRLLSPRGQGELLLPLFQVFHMAPSFVIPFFLSSPLIFVVSVFWCCVRGLPRILFWSCGVRFHFSLCALSVTLETVIFPISGSLLSSLILGSVGFSSSVLTSPLGFPYDSLPLLLTF